MPLLAAAIFLSAFLLFQVQPLIARLILPWFGGTPAVWTTCMLFFQALLLGGYLYAHRLAKLPARRQAWTHGGLLALAAVALAAQLAAWGGMVGASLQPIDSLRPVARILLLLTLSVGLPYFTLSTTGPLLQAWSLRLMPERSAYRLYALSNAGSLLALLSYPFLVEPLLSLRVQQRLWAAGFALFAAAVVTLALRVGRQSPAPAAAAPAEPATPQAAAATPAVRALWVGLAATASALLLAATNQLCQEVAVVPFLWVLPLALYLLSFILTFESDRWYRRAIFLPALGLFTTAAGVALYQGTLLDLPFQVGIYAALVFLGSMVCHGELARLRPPAAGLTGFYLRVSAGGALGGLFVGIVAPLVFRYFWELHASIGALWLFVLLALANDPASVLNGRRPRLAKAGVGVWFAFVVLLLGSHLGEPLQAAVEVRRNFYGVLKVIAQREGRPQWVGLEHGRILHGLQLTEAGKRREPTSYFWNKTAVGLAFENHPKRARGEPLSAGVIGLGTGTLAAYGRPGDRLRFYEISPDVVSLARGEGGHFSFLTDCPSTVEVVLGDARLSLERELATGAGQGFDLLVLDAFSSDAIPAHLLTREAFALYLRHLAPGGALLAHISNRYLDLEPVVVRLAQELGLQILRVYTDEPASGGTGVERTANWMVLSPDAAWTQIPPLAAAGTTKTSAPGPLWTDDYGALLQAVRLP